ncbi:hypothetical protein [Wolbachia endosymbiont (group B) of Villa cingulata]|uniref:TomO hydrophobic C-terminal domain-containing protein n=1 Tax=Wolbachia endosymbiont (group B) of Villa cingulata TaxID=3066157 RepID=UPI003341A654
MTRGKIIGVANQQVDIHSFPEKDQNETHYSPNTITKLEFKLTQHLLIKVKANESNKDANSGNQAYKDLPRMSFIINDKPIDSRFVTQLYDELNQNDKRQIAKHVFTKMFEHAKAEVPNDHILEELITHCNQAGYEFAMYEQMHSILAKYNLIPIVSEKTIHICDSNADSVNIEYRKIIRVAELNNPEKEICRSNSSLKFTLKFQSDRVDYENGKVILTIPKQLSNYKANDNSLLDDINKHFKDADNAAVESLIANIGEGPKSFIADQEDLNNDKESSLVIIPENPTLDLESAVESVKGAINVKNVDALSDCVDVVRDNVISVSPQKGLKVVEKILEMVGNFTKEQDKAWVTYPTNPIIGVIYSTSQYCYGYISQEDYKKVKSLEDILRKIQSNLIKGTNNDSNKGLPIINVEDVSLTVTNQTELLNLVNENCSASSINSFDNRLVDRDYHTTQDSQYIIEQTTDKKITPISANSLSVSDKKSMFTEKSDSMIKISCSQQNPVSDSYKETKMPNSGQFIKFSDRNNENESPNIMKPVAKQSTQVTSKRRISRVCNSKFNPTLPSENLNKVSSWSKPNKKSSLTQERFSASTHATSNVEKNIHRLKPKLNNPRQSLTEKTNELTRVKGQLTEKEKEPNNASQRVSQIEKEKNFEKQKLEELKNGKIQETQGKITQLIVVESKNNDLKAQVQKSESTNEQLENQIKNLEKQLKSKNKDIEGKKEKDLTVSTRKTKDKINYASAFFILSVVCTVGANLPIPYLIIRITFAVIASASLLVGLYCSCKANTALKNVEVDQQSNLAIA